MNDNTKIEVAREVMNAMIGRYGQDGYDKSNETLMILLEDEKEMNNFNFAVIDKIINVYGPMVNGDKKNKLTKSVISQAMPCRTIRDRLIITGYCGLEK